MLRGLITWQWAPDCRPARQAGQLLGLTRLGSIFSLTESFGSSLPENKHDARERCAFARVHSARKKAGIDAGFLVAWRCAQAFFGECDTHQPFALTALPGNNWHGP